jgi:hypothetical protein
MNIFSRSTLFSPQEAGRVKGPGSMKVCEGLNVRDMCIKPICIGLGGISRFFCNNEATSTCRDCRDGKRYCKRPSQIDC